MLKNPILPMLCMLVLATGAAAQVQQEDPPLLHRDYLASGARNFREGNYEEALEDLQKARISDPQSAVVAYYLGATLKKMQQYDKALPHLRDSVTLQPPVKLAFLELADTYYAANRNEEALQALEVAEKDDLDAGQTAFLKGLVQIRMRTYPEALASFDRVRTVSPKLASAADYQTAVIYQRLGRQKDARDLFLAVVEKDPDSDVAHMARQQADALTKRLEASHAFSAVANVQVQYDSNVLLKPDDASAAADISGSADTSLVASVRAEYAAPYALPYGLKLQYNLYVNAHQKEKAYDVQSHTIGAAPSYRLGENSISVPVTFNYTLVESSKYLRSYAVAPTYSFVTGEYQYASASLKYQKKDFLREPSYPDEDRSGSNTAAGISWFLLVAQQKGFVNLKYELDREQAAGANWRYLGNKAGCGVLYPFGDRVKYALGAEAYHQAYEGEHSFYGVKRTDRSYTANGQALYALTPSVDAQLQFTVIRNDSSLPVYTYHKNIVAVGVYARF